MKKIKNYLRPLLRKLGRDLVVYDHLHHPMARNARLLNHHKIQIVFDIGANTGQYAQELRQIGFSGKIISFEPLPKAFSKLQEWSHQDRNSIAINKAAGNYDGEVEFNVAANSTSSSVLDMLSTHTNAAPHSSIVDKALVKITKVDTIYNDYCRNNERVLLKIDTQGYEMPVLEGASKALDRVAALQLEMSLVPLYKGQVLFMEMLTWLDVRGFKLVDINPIFIHPESGEVLQVDAFFVRK